MSEVMDHKKIALSHEALQEIECAPIAALYFWTEYR